MPAYMSHAIMIDNLYKDNHSDERIFKIPLKKRNLRTFSLGSDLAYSSIFLNNDPHKSNTQDFFLYMINYIKENNLIENSEVMALLYGHISHYFMDINCHPYIYYIEKGYQNIGVIANHTLIEAYLDSYLSDKILKKDIMSLNEKYFNKGVFTKDVINLLNNTYGKIYHDYNITLAYKNTLLVFSSIEKFIKSGIFSKEILSEISGFKKFMDINNLTYHDLVNDEFKEYMHPITGKIDNKSFLQMYFLSIYQTLEAIINVNEYLYDGKDINLKNIFKNLSYNTGVNCKIKEDFVYVKKKR